MVALGLQGKLEEADELYLRAIGIQEKALGPDHSVLAVSLNNRAIGLRMQVIDLPSWRCLSVEARTSGGSFGGSDHPPIIRLWWLECGRRIAW